MGGFANDEIPLLVTTFYLFREAKFHYVKVMNSSIISLGFTLSDLLGRQLQVGSLTGAVYLLDNNKGVLRGAQREQKSRVEQKGKSSLDFDFQCEYKP